MPERKRQSKSKREPVSLAPLDPEEALRALLKVRPDKDVTDEDPSPKDKRIMDLLTTPNALGHCSYGRGTP